MGNSADRRRPRGKSEIYESESKRTPVIIKCGTGGVGPEIKSSRAQHKFRIIDYLQSLYWQYSRCVNGQALRNI